jgi:hypothetical protein
MDPQIRIDQVAPLPTTEPNEQTRKIIKYYSNTCIVPEAGDICIVHETCRYSCCWVVTRVSKDNKSFWARQLFLPEMHQPRQPGWDTFAAPRDQWLVSSEPETKFRTGWLTPKDNYQFYREYKLVPRCHHDTGF